MSLPGYSLSEEQKRKIEEEEAARIAEEKYREHVRRSMSSPPPPAPLPPNLRDKPRSGLIALVATVVVVFGVFAGIALSGYLHRAGSLRPVASSFLSRGTPVTVPLVHGQFQVPAQNYLSWTLVVPAENVRNYHVVGHYSAMGGGGNDIQAVIASEDEFQNWINGHQARAFYSTPGRVTTGAIDVVLPPGRYVLAFNNRFSVFTPKAVFAEITAAYERLN